MLRSLCLALLVVAALMASTIMSKAETKEGTSFSQYNADDQAILLATLDEMFKTWKSWGNQMHLPQTAFLTICEKDAPDDLLKLLHDAGHDVLPGAQFKFGSGVGLSLETISHTGTDKATVSGGYLYGNVGGNWGPFILEKKDGKWVVVSWTSVMVS